MTDRPVPLAAHLGRRALAVAPMLLGAVLRHSGVALRITEVEAYEGREDPGSHAYRGMTPRTEVMHGPAGRLYVYRSYGLHWCANVVCGEDGTASAVLLRAGEVVQGEEVAHARREAARQSRAGDGSRSVSARDLARGPANLTVALALTGQHHGLDLLAGGSSVTLDLPSEQVAPELLRSGARVGVAGPGGDGDRYPWRFWLADAPTVSAYRRAT